MGQIFFEELLCFFFGWIPTVIGRKIRQFAYRPFFKKSGLVHIGTNVLIIRGFGNIELGENVFVGNNSCICAHDDGNLKIGDNVYINLGSIVNASFGKVTIGDDCMIDPYCILRGANHKFDNKDKSMMWQGHTYGEIEVGHNVWLGSNCIITPNTKIAEGVVVGARAVVTKDTDRDSIIAGVPAKFIKHR